VSQRVVGSPELRARSKPQTIVCEDLSGEKKEGKLTKNKKGLQSPKGPQQRMKHAKNPPSTIIGNSAEQK